MAERPSETFRQGLAWLGFLVFVQVVVMAVGYGGVVAIHVLLPHHLVAALFVAIMDVGWMLADLWWLLVRAPRIEFVRGSSG